MAILAAFLLVAATMAGVNAPLGDAIGQEKSIAAATAEEPAQAKTLRSVKAKKGFKVNFYLFRHK